MTMILAILFILAGFGLAGIGLLFLSNATTGVGIIGLAVFSVAVGRIIQAQANHISLMSHLRAQAKESGAPTTSSATGGQSGRQEAESAQA